MKPTKIGQLLATATIGFLVAFALTWYLRRFGIHTPAIPWYVSVLLLVASVVVYSFGRRVKLYLNGENPKLTGQQAAFIAVLGKATAFGGVLLIGIYGSQAVLPLVNFSIESQQNRFWGALLSASASVILALVGFLVEGYCKLPPPENEEEAISSESPAT